MNQPKFRQYFSLMRKVNSNNLLRYFQDYLKHLYDNKTLTHIDLKEIDNNEAKRIFIEFLIIIIHDDIKEIRQNGNIIDHFESIKQLWKEIFPKIDSRVSATRYLALSEEIVVKKIAQRLRSEHICWLLDQFAKEVADAPTRLFAFVAEPIISADGIHSTEERCFIEKPERQEKINFFH